MRDAHLALELHVGEVAEEIAFWCPWALVETYEDAPIIAITARDEGRRRLEYRVRRGTRAAPIVHDLTEKISANRSAGIRALTRAQSVVQEIAEARMLPDGVVVRAAGGCVVVANIADGRRFATAPDGWTPRFVENGHHDEHRGVARAIADIGAQLVTDPDPVDPYGDRWDE